MMTVMSKRAVGVRCTGCERLLYTECGPSPCAFRRHGDERGMGAAAQRKVEEWRRISALMTEDGMTRKEATVWHDTYEV